MSNARLTYFIILIITYSFKGESSNFESLSMESQLRISRNQQMLTSIPQLLSDNDEIKNNEKKNVQHEKNGSFDRKSLNTNIKVELVDVIFNSELLSYKKIFSFIDDIKIDSNFENSISFAKMDIYYKIKKHVTRIKKEYEKFFLKISEFQTLSLQADNLEEKLNTILKPLIKESLKIKEIKQDEITITGFEETTDKKYTKNMVKYQFFSLTIENLKHLMRTVYKKPHKRDSND